MIYTLQKAGIWKRLAAWMFDEIFVCLLAVGFGFVLSGLLGYNGYNERLNEAYARYEEQYGIVFEISQDDYQAMTEGERQNFDAAVAALSADQEAMYLHQMTLQLSIVLITLGILLAMLAWEFFVPLRLGNGQTLGKKIFGIGLMRSDGVRVNNLQLFTRAILGKFTIETMVPVYIVLMFLWNVMDITGTVVLLGLLVGQVISIAVTRTNAAIHDLLAGTAAVDINSQMIFPSNEALIEYQKKAAAEKAARQPY